MIKIKSIKFKDHKILGDLELDFCDKNGNPADTIIIAGENGTGKTTILEEIKNILEYNFKNIVNCQIEYDENEVRYENGDFWINEEQITDGINFAGGVSGNMLFRNRTPFNYIYSTVNINFSPNVKVKNIGATSLDIKTTPFTNIKSNETTAINIKQLFVDIVNFDNNIIVDNLRQNIGKILTKEMLSSRIERFKNAFDFMFDDIKYKCIKNIDNSNVLFDMFSNNKDTKKYFEICFEKNDKEISIDDLSSGEKQIVFRGAFLLRDKEALNGAVVLIDEPEVSMHPEWQNKIMDFYKKIFQNKNGEQTSQIIVTTHSPFIIHNENRYNDKVIVLQKAEKGVKASDKPEYYSVDTIQAVADAFNILNFSIDNNENIVFLEGKTDEQYFNKAIEVFGIKNLSFVFKWIGHIGQNNQEEFTGKSALNSAYSFAKGHNSNGIKVFLYDCDAKKSDEQWNNCYIRSISNYNNIKEIKAGIENALVLDDIKNFKDFFNNKTEKGNYGEEKIIPEFKKQEFCNYICSLDNKELETILSNLKTEIEKLKELFK